MSKLQVSKMATISYKPIFSILFFLRETQNIHRITNKHLYIKWFTSIQPCTENNETRWTEVKHGTICRVFTSMEARARRAPDNKHQNNEGGKGVLRVLENPR